MFYDIYFFNFRDKRISKELQNLETKKETTTIHLFKYFFITPKVFYFIHYFKVIEIYSVAFVKYLFFFNVLKILLKYMKFSSFSTILKAPRFSKIKKIWMALEKAEKWCKRENHQTGLFYILFKKNLEYVERRKVWKFRKTRNVFKYVLKNSPNLKEP